MSKLRRTYSGPASDMREAKLLFPRISHTCRTNAPTSFSPKANPVTPSARASMPPKADVTTGTRDACASSRTIHQDPAVDSFQRKAARPYSFTEQDGLPSLIGSHLSLNKGLRNAEQFLSIDDDLFFVLSLFHPRNFYGSPPLRKLLRRKQRYASRSFGR
jgi:hypothetical protein